MASRWVNTAAADRVGDVVRGNVHRLDGRDGTGLGRRDALLQLSHLGGQRRLVADGGGHPAEEGGHLAAGLREAEDVVHEQEDVHPFVTEVFRHRERGERDAQARTRRFVHLSEDEACLLQNLRLLHLLPQVIAFTGPLTDAGEDRVPAVLGGDVVDELLDDHGLADPGPAEQPGLAAAHVGTQEVDDLDAGLEKLRLRLQLGKRHPGSVDGHPFLRGRRAPAVHGVPQQVEHAPEHLLAHRHGDGGARVHDRASAGDAVRGIQRHRPDTVAAEVLLHFAHQVRLAAAELGIDDQGIADFGQMPLFELRVQDGSDHLDHRPLAACAHALPPSLPPMISIISLVICAWRTRL